MTSVVEFLRNVAAGAWAPVAIAFLLEHVKWFQALQSEARKWVVLGLFVALPLAATALLKYVPAYIWTELEPFWNALAIGFAGWVVSQAAHRWDKQQRAS